MTIDEGQDVQHGCYIGVVVSGGFFKIFQGLLADGHRHLVTTLRHVLND